MSDFYSSPSQQQASAIQPLAAKALLEWGIAEASLELLKYRENAVFKVTTAQQENYALRVHRFNYHSDAALVSELGWMKALNDSGIYTPAVIPALDQQLFKVIAVDGVPEPRQCDLLSWIDGQPLGAVEDPELDAVDSLIKNYQQVGELAARIHNQSEAWQRPANFARHAWGLDGLTGQNPLWGRYWDLPALSAEQKALVLRAGEKVRGELRKFGNGADRYGLIHADLIPDNLMCADERVMLIDFDDSGFGWHLFEIATSLFFYMGSERFDEISATMVQGYRQHRQLPDQHLEMLPLFFVARGLTYLGWAHTRSEMETAQQMTPMVVEMVCQLAEDFMSD